MERFRNPQKQDSVVSIPQDLIIEILTKLPAKSIPKLIVVSKLWSCIIRSKYFTDLYLTRSLTRPCVLFTFTFHRGSTLFFHSVSEYVRNSCSTTTTLPPSPLYDVSPPIRGLICCQDSSKIVIANPSTGQFVDLPKVKTRRRGISTFLGYDSIKDEYKVLSMTVVQRADKYGPVVAEEHQVFTLGAQKNKKKKKKETWRMIECKHPHCPVTKGQCYNGVVYYGAWSNTHRKGEESLIVGFDVRLEEFSLVKLPDGVEIKPHHQSELVKYQKKIALVDGLHQGNVELWVLEDVEIQRWSKIHVVVPGWADLVGQTMLHCRGAISSGEFIFTAAYGYPGPLYIISYDSKENIGRRIEIGEIGGIGYRSDSIRVFLDHVESPMFL